MGDLDSAESDVYQDFWYDQVGAVVQPCSSDPPRRIISPDKKHWIEIALVDDEGHPVPDVRYQIRLPDGTVQSGNLDSRGLARLDGIDAGACKVWFPDLDRTAWKPLAA